MRSVTRADLPRGFLSARPVRAATRGGRNGPHGAVVSIRATRAGRDRLGPRRVRGMRRFYPRDPCGPRLSDAGLVCLMAGVSIRATRAGRDAARVTSRDRQAKVSIRATRAGRDLVLAGPTRLGQCFYPRDPCGPRLAQIDLVIVEEAVSIRATRAGRDMVIRTANRPCSSFYPRDPCGPRRAPHVLRQVQHAVSIRATRAGRDTRPALSHARPERFLSARPVRAATWARKWASP